MAFLIDQLNNSGLFAQSAYSASIATCDSDGNIITATYLSSVDLTPYQTTADMINYQTVSGMSAYATTGAVNNKLDTTAFSDVSGTFLTAHQSLDGYATTAWVDSQGYLTAHQPISADEWNNVYDTVNVYSGSWTGSESSPTASVDSNGSIDIVSSNNTVYFDVNGTWFNNAVNSAVDVPTGVMVESACEYNAVNEISGYNGSAIAQYGAEKQWIVHDDTLVHAANSAQYALGVNLSAVAQLLGVDETVLWSGAAAVSNCTLAEPITNFNSVKFLLYGREDTNRTRMWFECETTNDTWNIQYADGTNYVYTQFIQLSSTDTTLSAIRYKEINYGALNSTAVSIGGATGTYPAIIKAVVGIGRKQ